VKRRLIGVGSGAVVVPGPVGVVAFGVILRGCTACQGTECGRCGAGSGGTEGPSAAGGVGDPEGGQAGEVDRGGEEVEIGADTQESPRAGTAAAVAAAHQMGDLAFDLGAGGPVVGLPGGIGLLEVGFPS
jgi:hypothetical protein